MLTIVYYFLQVMLCSGMMMGYYWLALRNKRFHRYNRFYLLIVALLSWVVPLIKIRWSHPVATGNPQVLQFLSVLADNNSQMDETFNHHWFPWSWHAIAIIIYVTVAGILLMGMLWTFFRLYRLLQKHSCQNVGDVYLILTRAKGTPFSFFRYIFWNEDIDMHSQAGKQILEHELTHVQQKHSFDKLFIQLILIGGWFNPFFWLLRKEMDMIHEFIADKKAVADGDTASLAQMLLTATYPQQRFLLTHPFFFSPIKRRLHMLTNHQHPRFSYFRRLIVLPLLAIVIVLFAFRNKEQRANVTISVASVMENVIKQEETGFSQQKYDNKQASRTLNLSDPGFDTLITQQTVKMDTVKPGFELKNNLQGKQLLIATIQEKLSRNVYERQKKLFNDQMISRAELEQAYHTAEANYNAAKAGLKSGEASKKLQLAQFDLQQEMMRKSDTIQKDSVKAVRIVHGNNIKIIDTVQHPSFSPMIIVDGIKVKSLTSVKPADIYSVSVWKDQEAIRLYGDAGKNGVVEITTTKNKHQVLQLAVINAPEFPGGEAAWVKYLQRNLSVEFLKTKAAPPGKYTVVVGFIVEENGTLTEIQAENDPGYGCAEAAVKLISKGPKWIPALQDTKPVSMKIKKTISFILP